MGTLAATLLVLAGTTLDGQDPAAKKVFVLPHVLEAVGKAIDTPAPAGLSAADQKAYAAQTVWLRSVQTRIQPLAAEYSVKAPRDVATGQSSGKRQHGPGVIVRGWDPLQKAIEDESRQFETLSGLLKARHDIAMNAIRNLKG
ncbi:MAG: hypothetical protein ACKVZ0_22160 [Gemmatimonadales bacterium]